MKIVVFYPYDTGARAFLGGVSKVAVSNVMAIHLNGDQPVLVLPKGNSGLISYVHKNLPYCEVCPVAFTTLSLYRSIDNIFKRAIKIVQNLLQVAKSKKNLKKCFERIKPDVIHYHEVVCYNLLNLYTECKIVVHIHSFLFVSNKLLFPRITKSIRKYADEVISPTKSIKAALDPYIDNITIVRTAYLDLEDETIETPAICNEVELLRRDHVVFSFVGRITNVKRLEHFLQALVSVSNDVRKKVRYLVIGGCYTVGDEDYKKGLDLFIATHNLNDNVIFAGYVNPIESILPFIDYGAMLTESEAMPMVGIEYMKYSIPTIGYDAPGINDFLVDGENGYLVRNGDIDHLAEAITKAVNTPPDSFKESIAKQFYGYSVESFAMAIQSLYTRKR